MAKNVFGISELVLRIAAYLDTRSLGCCVQVSKAWARHFVPFLWRSFRLSALEYYKEDNHDLYLVRKRRFFQLRESACRSFAKNGHLIRELIAEHPRRLIFPVRFCVNLTTLVCRFTYPDGNGFANDGHEAVTYVQELVVRNPHLHTLRLGDPLDRCILEYPWSLRSNNKITAEHFQHFQKLSNLRHLTVAMGDADYINFCTRFPRIVEASFRLESVQSILHPYHSQVTIHGSNSDGDRDHDQVVRHGTSMVQCSLKQLLLEVNLDRLDPQMVQCVLRRFPRLERLRIQDDNWNSLFVDFSTDSSGWQAYDDIHPKESKSASGGHLLIIGGFKEADYEVAKTITSLPVRLKQVHWRYLGHRTIEALVAHSSESLEDVSGGEWYPLNFELDVPTSAGLLLACCPRLKRLDTPRLKVHILHLMAHPWVCCDHLEELTCTIDGMPKMSSAERDLIGTLKKREGWQHGQGQNYRDERLTEAEQRVLGKQDLIHQYHQALLEQTRKCPNLRHIDFEGQGRNEFSP